MTKKDNAGMELQLLISLASGFLFGPLSYSILTSIVFVVIFEICVFHYSMIYPPEVRYIDRFLINLLFFFGWIIGRRLMLNESGLEGVYESLYYNWAVVSI